MTTKSAKRVSAGARANRKGKAWERAVNRALRVLYPDRKIYRGDQRRRGGSAAGEGCDNEGTPFWVEAKHWKKVNIDKALQQARDKQAERTDERPIVIIAKSDNCEPFVSMPLEDWFNLVDEVNTLRTSSSWTPPQSATYWKHALKKGPSE